jgi:glycosyltransferase involved in cell wall biosynthesis
VNKGGHGLSVIIPALNSEKTIVEAINSALAQTGVNVEVIVVDAGSTDQTVTIVKTINDPRVHLFSGNGSLFAGAARNLGVVAAKSFWLSFLDADDLWPYCVTDHLFEVISDATCDLAVGHSLTFSDEAPPDLSLHAPLGNSLRGPLAGSVLLSKQLFLKVGFFDADLPVGEFIDWVARARNLGVREVPSANVVLFRRKHSANTSHTRRGEFASSVLKIALAHRARNSQKS